jgi:hypothetical protein
MAIKLGGLELATPGDIVVGGGAYAIGFAVDAFFFSGGATSATTAGACAAGALSLKYAVQTALGSKKRAPERKADEPSVDTNQSDGKPKTDSARKRKIRP